MKVTIFDFMYQLNKTAFIYKNISELKKYPKFNENFAFFSFEYKEYQCIINQKNYRTTLNKLQRSLVDVRWYVNKQGKLPEHKLL